MECQRNTFFKLSLHLIPSNCIKSVILGYLLKHPFNITAAEIEIKLIEHLFTFLFSRVKGNEIPNLRIVFRMINVFKCFNVILTMYYAPDGIQRNMSANKPHSLFVCFIQILNFSELCKYIN